MKAGELVVSNLFSDWRRKVTMCGKDTGCGSPRTTSKRGWGEARRYGLRLTQLVSCQTLNLFKFESCLNET